MKQILAMKWVAYAKAHVEGDDYYFSYDFEIPGDLYNALIDTMYREKPITSCDRFNELQIYAQLALNYRKLCGYEEGFWEKDDDETDMDYWGYIKEYNQNRENINAELVYLRIFDPYAEERFVDYCLDMPVEDESVGKKKEFYWIYNGETYEWSIDYRSKEDYTVSRIRSHVSYSEYVKFLNGNSSIYPPYDKIIAALKNGEVHSSLKNM